MAAQDSIDALKQQVAESSHILDHQGLADYHGHVSARVPGTRQFLIKPVLRAHNQITAEDILTVDMDEYKENYQSYWAPLRDHRGVITSPIPPRETMMHVAVYEARPDVGAVVHTHQLIATAVGVGNVPIKPLYQQASPFAPETPIFPSPRLIVTAEDGHAVADCLGDRTALLLQGHGVVVAGPEVDSAVVNTVYLERTAIMQIIATIVGTATPLREEDIRNLAADMARRAPHAFAYFRSLVPDIDQRLGREAPKRR